MIDRLIELSIRHRARTIIAACVLAICGVIAVGRTPMDAIPDLSENQVLVFADWPGHNPRELDEQVTSTLSRHLQGIAGVRVVRGASEAGYALLHLIFDDSVRFETARARVQERLTLLGDALPSGVTPRLAPDAVPTGQIFWYTLDGDGFDLGRLRDIQDWSLRPQLSSVPGVAEVASVGGHVREFVIELDLTKLADLGLTPRDVCDAVEHSQAILGGNVIHKGNAEFLVHAPASFGASASNLEDMDRQTLRDLEAVLVPGTEHVAHAARVRQQEQIETDAREPRMPHTPQMPHVSRLRDIARVSIAPKPRRGVFEKDGNEVVGGVIAMRYGHNPLEVTRAIRRKLTELRAGLPHGVRIVPCYDRTPLIEGAVATVTGTLLEAMLGATLCVLLVLRHLRSSCIIAITLPLAALASFVCMAVLRTLGIADIQTNIMSLSGIVISIGVLVDSSIVMAENAMTHLRREFGDQPVTGDVRATVLAACRTVGRPIFFSVLIMLISFLPVFALGGIDGKLFRPLAFTKTFALIAVALLSVTLVPALCTLFLRGRMRAETESWLVRGVMEVYRPVLNYLLDHPAVMAWMIGVTFVVGVTPIGHEGLFRAVLFVSLIAVGWTSLAHQPEASARERRNQRNQNLARASGWCGSLILIALMAQQTMQPLGTDLRVPLDEGMVMDMPISVPRISVTQAGDDLKARDMLLCRFPEVDMVVGKAGRAETPFDPAPLDMIETMVSFRSAEFWPKRKLRRADAEQQGREVIQSLLKSKLIATPLETTDFIESVAAAHARCELGLREYAYHRHQEFQRQLSRRLIQSTLARLAERWHDAGRLTRAMQSGDFASMQESLAPHLSTHLAMSLEEDDLRTIAEHAWEQLAEKNLLADESATPRTTPVMDRLWQSAYPVLGREAPSEFAQLRSELQREHRAAWAEHTATVNRELLDRGLRSFTQLVAEEVLSRADEVDPRVETWLEQIAAAREPRGQAPQNSKSAGGSVETNQIATPPILNSAVPDPSTDHHRGGRNLPPLALIDPVPELDAILSEQSRRFAQWAFLWPFERDELTGFGGELDRALQMPGWINVWTRPIQNRVDMLATGINTEIGVRVLGTNLEQVVATSEEIAAVLRGVPGAADVIADPIRGKGYLEIVPNRERMAEFGVDPRDLWSVIETALGGKQVATILSGRERHDVRVRVMRDAVRDELAVRQLPVPCRWAVAHAARVRQWPQASPETKAQIENETQSTHASRVRHIPLSDVADVRIAEGPATIKSENGLLRNYVRLNVRGRGTFDFLADAKRAIAEEIQLPEGTSLEWTGQFEHAAETAWTLLWITPLVIGLILWILWLTYRDWADTGLMLLSVPGAIAGGVFFQWLFGYRWSVPVAVGFLACFGMATSTGIIMLVYLREALEKRGPLASLTEADLRAAVIEGAVHRLRPKLLTEGTTILGLAPMLWASGIGAEVIRPMAAPVLGGILIADEVIDLFLPVLFYWVRRRRWQAMQPTLPAKESL
ncbi:MAG: efflux RND transporter permease subunit [Planctomycetaceae bacterium]